MGLWITPTEMLSRTAFYHFYKTVTCSSEAVMRLKVSADSRYQLRVNGEYICEGPCTGDHLHWRYEEVTVPLGILKNGDNEIYIRVLHVSEEHFNPIARKERPALWVSGTLTDGGVESRIATDDKWRCYMDEGIFFPNSTAFAVQSFMAPCMDVQSEDMLTEVGVRPYLQERPNCTNHVGQMDKYLLEPRTIPILKPAQPLALKAVMEGEGFVIFDAGAYTTAYPTFSFEGGAGGVIKFIYAECYYTVSENRQLIKGMRDEVGEDLVGSFDTVRLNGKVQEFTPYWYRAFRFIKVELPKGTRLLRAEYRPFFYPLEETGVFECSDPIRNAMWKVSKNTLLCCTHETFVDCPYYEQCQYDMDSAIEMLVMLRLTSDGRMARKCLTDLARSQRADGMLCAHYPSIVVQIIPTFSLFWILMLRDYVTYTGDLELADELLPTAEGVLNFFKRHRTPEGICGATPYWHYTDWVPAWKDGIPVGGKENPITVTTLIYSAALSATASICRSLGRLGLAEEYEERAEEANRAVNTHCFDEKAGMYVDVYGVAPEYSEHTAVWAVLCGAKKGRAARALMDTAFDRAANVHRATFSFNYYSFRALEKAGLYEKYAPALFDGWKRMLDLHCTTWCENPDNPRSECHAWSAAPIYENSAMVLGVQPLSDGFSETLIKPDIASYDWAKGTVPTPNGIIAVSWERVNGVKLLKVVSPFGIKKRIELPDLEPVVTDAEIYTVKFIE